jgi:hypothetical protein
LRFEEVTMNQPEVIKIDEVEYVRKDSIDSRLVDLSSEVGPWEIGKNYLLRLVTVYDAGKLIGVGPQELILEDASWIPDTGRFADVLKSCDFSEVEPFPKGRVIVNRDAVIDAVRIDTVPRKQK